MSIDGMDFASVPAALRAKDERIAELEAALAPFAALRTFSIEIGDEKATVRVNKKDILAAKLALER